MKDPIERQDVIDEIEERKNANGYCNVAVISELNRLEGYIMRLPSAEFKRKMGWWLIREGISDAQCSECGMYFNDVYDMENSDAFCRHCGTKMEGLKVVEDE